MTLVCETVALSWGWYVPLRARAPAEARSWLPHQSCRHHVPRVGRSNSQLRREFHEDYLAFLTDGSAH